MRFGICNEIFEGWEWNKLCEFIAQLGYQGLEIAPFTLAENADDISLVQRRRLRETAYNCGVEVLGLHWLLVKPAGLHLTHPDRAVRKTTAEYLKTLVNLCGDLGGKVMVIGSPNQRNLLPGVSRQQADDYAGEVLDEVLPLAEQRSVTLALEPLDASTYLQTVAEVVEFVQNHSHPFLQINLDVKSMSAEAVSIPELIHLAAGRIAHFQVNDPNLWGPGMGSLRYEPIISALREVGYDGWLSVEVFDTKPGPERIARESLQYLQKVVGDRGS